jgi:hypothetical protein
LKGNIESVTCPSGDTNGSLHILCLDVVLTATTTYEGAASCEDLAAQVAAGGGVQGEVEIEKSDVCSAPVAKKVSIEDANHDGTPDDIGGDDDSGGHDGSGADDGSGTEAGSGGNDSSDSSQAG